jgi:predicted kinase
MGCAGSGKSTLARQVLQRRPMTYLNKDTVWRHLLKSVKSRDEYLAQRELWYGTLYAVVEENLGMGGSVLLDAPHVRQVQDPRWCLEIQGLVRRAKVRLRCVYCHAAEPTLRKRLRDRGLERDSWKLAHWALFQEAEPIIATVPFGHLMVDTDRPVRECLERVLHYLEIAP